MKNIFTIICIITLLFLFKCSKEYRVKDIVEKPNFENYISCFFMGELGTLPTGCEINDVKMTGDSVSVCGRAFDMDTKEPFDVDIWVGSLVEKTNDNGKKDLVPLKRTFLSTTDNDGIFCLKFNVNKNDVLFMDQIGYDPAVFEVYQYLQDARLIE